MLDVDKVVVVGNFCGGVMVLGLMAIDLWVLVVFVLFGFSVFGVLSNNIMDDVIVLVGFVVGGLFDIVGFNVVVDYNVFVEGILGMVVNCFEGGY